MVGEDVVALPGAGGVQALDVIEYEDIGKLMLLAMKRIRQENL